jgi:hypothetical protein
MGIRWQRSGMAQTVTRGKEPINAGDRFGRLTVVALTTQGKTHAVCRCECGSEKNVQLHNLRSGGTRSCGCLRRDWNARHKTTHGGSKTAEYKVWQGMHKRCSNPRCKSFADYGGRGIQVCDHWNEFPAFIADMGPRPSAKHSLDRIDVNGDYGPRNCRWATPVEQVRNRRRRSRGQFVTVNEILSAHGLVF